MGSFEENLAKIEEVMKRIQWDGIKSNIDKCKLTVPKVEYLGYIITQEGIKPYSKTIGAVINLERPKDKKQVRQFLGMVQYYRELWPKHIEILVPLTELTKCRPTKNIPIEWNSAWTELFQKIKALISKETILAYLYFSKDLTIHTDASNVQLGAVIMQEGKPLAFYSKKLSKAQINYTMTEK